MHSIIDLLSFCLFVLLRLLEVIRFFLAAQAILCQKYYILFRHLLNVMLKLLAKKENL